MKNDSIVPGHATKLKNNKSDLPPYKYQIYCQAQVPVLKSVDKSLDAILVYKLLH